MTIIQHLTCLEWENTVDDCYMGGFMSIVCAESCDNCMQQSVVGMDIASQWDLSLHSQHDSFDRGKQCVD